MRYATIRAGMNRNRLKMKNNSQLCPLRRATRAGQKASATKMRMPTTPIAAQPAEDVASMSDSFLFSPPNGGLFHGTDRSLGLHHTIGVISQNRLRSGDAAGSPMTRHLGARCSWGAQLRL